MKKLTFVLALMFSTIFAQAQIPCEISQNATITIPVLYYADENINFTTATATDLTCYLVSAASSTIVETTNTGFEATGEAYNIMLPSNLLSTVGIYQFNYSHAECIKGFVYLDVLPSLIYDDQYGITDRIATIDGIADAILIDTSTTIPASIVASDLNINDVTALIIASGNIIPSTGINLSTLPIVTHAGSTPFNYMFSGISRYATAPNIAITIQDTVSGFNQYATASAFTHVSAQNYMNTVDDAPVWEHVWYYTVNTNTIPFGNYKVFVHSTSMTYPVCALGSLIHNTTTPVDLTGIVTEDYMVANLIHPTSQSFSDLLSGGNIEWTVYRAELPHTRTVAEFTSASNRSYATQSVYGSQVVYPQNFESAAGVTSKATKWFVYDYDDAWMNLADARSIIYEVTMTIPEFATIEGVTITVSGGE